MHAAVSCKPMKRRLGNDVGHAYDDNEPFEAKIYLHYSGSTILCSSMVGNVGAGSDIVRSVGE
jgi:hypothetical protein